MENQDTRPGGFRPAYEELPPHVVTANQLVAYNIAYWRQAKGMTQDELGILLEKYTGRPWSKATVSAAERSWDGKRIRQFDADELLALCETLEVPLPALLTPPTDDGVKFRYGIVTSPDAGGDEGMSVRDLLGYLLPDTADDEEGNLGDFKRRFEFAVDFHYGEGTFGSLNRYSAASETEEEQLRGRIGILKYQRDALRVVMADIERESASIAQALEERNVGQRNEDQADGRLDECRARMRAALTAREDAVMLMDLMSLAFAVPDEFDRHECHHLLHELTQLLLTNDRQSATPDLMHDVYLMFADALGKASDYRTPWFKLQSFCQKMLDSGIRRDFAERIAAALDDAGDDAESVLEKFGVDKLRAHTVLRMNGIKEPANLRALFPPPPKVSP